MATIKRRACLRPRHSTWLEMFSERVVAASEPRQNQNHSEGLRPWQPQKIYYFSNATHMDFFTGQGPQYAASDVAPKRHLPYGQIAAEEFIYHRTTGSEGGTGLLEHGADTALISSPKQKWYRASGTYGIAGIPCTREPRQLR
jgi:hypothetical protein